MDLLTVISPVLAVISLILATCGAYFAAMCAYWQLDSKRIAEITTELKTLKADIQLLPYSDKFDQLFKDAENIIDKWMRPCHFVVQSFRWLSCVLTIIVCLFMIIAACFIEETKFVEAVKQGIFYNKWLLLFYVAILVITICINEICLRVVRKARSKLEGVMKTIDAQKNWSADVADRSVRGIKVAP